MASPEERLQVENVAAGMLADLWKIDFSSESDRSSKGEGRREGSADGSLGLRSREVVGDSKGVVRRIDLSRRDEDHRVESLPGSDGVSEVATGLREASEVSRWEEGEELREEVDRQSKDRREMKMRRGG